jgi:hypothetical protein
MVNYTLFIKKNVKEAFHKTGVGFSEAYTFLDSFEYGLVKDASGNKYFTKEELKNAEHIRPISESRRDNTTARIEEIFEAADRKLSIAAADNSEPSTECDSQRDKPS